MFTVVCYAGSVDVTFGIVFVLFVWQVFFPCFGEKVWVLLFFLLAFNSFVLCSFGKIPYKT